MKNLMFNVNAQSSSVLLPQDLLRKAGQTYYADKHVTIHCEPLTRDGEPYWAMDNFRLSGRVEGNPSHIFYTQPSWGLHFMEKYGKHRVKCVAYACDPEIHLQKRLEKEYDVGFIGNFNDGDGRKEFIDAVSPHFKCFISSHTPTDEISNALSRCRVLLNHIRYEEINIRFFETLAIGAQVCTRTPSLGLFAREGKSFLTFETPQEAIEILRMLLNDEARVKDMEMHAREDALRNTYKHRVEEMLSFIHLL